MRKVNTRKLKDELQALASVLVGIILVYCQLNKIVPGVETNIALAISGVIAYLGLPLGIMIIVFGFAGFMEVRNKKYSYKKYPRNKRRS